MGYFLCAFGINLKSIVNNTKNSKMKKFFAIAIIAASFAACNNSGEGSGAKDTTTVAPVDTTSKMADTTNKMSADTSHKMSADTSHKMSADTSKKK